MEGSINKTSMGSMRREKRSGAELSGEERKNRFIKGKPVEL